MRIYFCSAPCGSGKTYSLIQRACDWAETGRRILVLQPTVELIAKTVERELLTRPNPPRHKVFHGGVVSGSVAAALTEYLKQTDDEGQIVFATHQVVPYIGFWPNRDTWDVFVDEELQVVRHNSYDIPDTHRLITDLIGTTWHNAIYSSVIVQDHAQLEKMATNKNHDQILETFRETAQTLQNPNWDSFVNAELFEKLKSEKSNSLSVHSTLKPSVLAGFGSVFMAAANFQDSLVHQLWSQKGIEFREDKNLASSLRFQQHTNGHLITIKYADEKSWSKKRRLTKLNPDNTTVMDAIGRAATATFQNQPFLWQANKSVSGNFFDGKGERLPNLPHGLNDYSHINNVVFLSSLNPSPDHFRFLETQGLSGEDVRRATYYAPAYQSVMRTSIRDENNKEPKTIIPPDRGLADYLNERFPGAKTEKLETGIPDDGEPKKAGRPRKYQNDNERKAHHKRKKKLAEDLLWLKMGPYHLNPLGVEKPPMIGDEMGIEGLYSSFVAHLPLAATLYKNKKSNTPIYRDDEEFVSDLELWHSRELEDREKNFLISPAIFDPNHPDREGNEKRGRNNIRYLQNIWLDFENGELKPGEIPNLFPHNRLVVTNTFNHTSGAPRFRVIFLRVRPETSGRIAEFSEHEAD